MQNSIGIQLRSPLSESVVYPTNISFLQLIVDKMNGELDIMDINRKLSDPAYRELCKQSENSPVLKKIFSKLGIED